MDGKGEPADSVSAFKNLVEVHNIVAEIGTNFSSCNIPMASVADEVKVPIIGTAASNELVTVDEKRQAAPLFLPYVLHRLTSAPSSATMPMTRCPGTLLCSPWPANTNSESVGQFLRDAFTKGGTMADVSSARMATWDFRAQLANIGAKNPDIVFVIMNDYAKNATFAKQAREMGTTAC